MFCRLKNDTDFGKIHIPAPVTSSNLFISEAIKHSYTHFISATGSCKFKTSKNWYDSLYISVLRTFRGHLVRVWTWGMDNEKSWTFPQTPWETPSHFCPSMNLTYKWRYNERLLDTYCCMVLVLFILTLVLAWKGIHVDPCLSRTWRWFEAVEI